MKISKRDAAEQIASYLHGKTTLEELVAWAEDTLLDGDLDVQDAEVLRPILGRLGVSDVRAFGLSWEDCRDFLRELGFSAQVEIGLVGSPHE